MGLAEQIRKRIKGKAISHKPELAGRVHISSSYAGGEAFPDMDSFVGWATVYQSYIWLKKGIKFIADSIKFLPVMVVDGNGEEQTGHYITQLLAYVNDTETAADLWSKYVIYKYLGGEFFLEFVPDNRGNPVEVWARRPDKMIVVPDAAPERRLYPRVAGYRNEDDRDYIIPPELMWFDKFTNPLNEWRGLNVIAAAREGISIDVFAHQAIKTFLRKGSRPDFVVVAPQGITKTELDKMEMQFDSKFSGADKVHRPFFAEEGITDIKTLSHPPKDIQWLEDSRFSREEVGAILNMPDLLMGFGTEAYDNSDKLNAHMMYYWQMNGVPLVSSRDDSLTNFFHQHYPRLLAPDHRIATDLSSVAVLREDYGDKLAQAQQLFTMGVPFEQINERLELGIDYAPPVMVDSGEKAAELERFRRWAKKRMRTGKTVNVAEFDSGILIDSDKAAELGEMMKAARIIPEGADEPLPPLPGGDVTISDADIQKAIDQWDSTFKDYRGLLDAQSNISGEDL